MASDSLNVRASDQGAYSRLVFELPAPSSYKIEKTDRGAVINFQKNTKLDAEILKSLKVPNIDSISVLGSDPLRISVTFSGQSRVRDLSIGSRIIIDIFDPDEDNNKPELPAKPPEQKPSPQVEKIAKTESKITVQPKPKEKQVGIEKALADLAKNNAQIITSGEATKKTESSPQQQTAAQPQKENSEKSTETPAQQGIQLKATEASSIILLSATQAFGVSVFERNGKLFLANDKSDLFTKPQISGPQANKIALVQELPSESGKVFSIQIPKGNSYRGQGGGPVWRVMFSPDTNPSTTAIPVEPVRESGASGVKGGGKIIWPIRGARSILDFEDPVSGEKIKIITVDKADQFAGPERRFADFDVLRSVVGLAIVPKVDDLEIKLTSEAVEISRPGGLSFVDESLIKTTKTKIESKSPENNAGTQRLFDFNNWQLGGLSAIHENRTVLLGGLKDLSEGAQSESLLTLAKMYLSNGMGYEAQGVMRLALMQNALLSQSPEFRALEGAAQVISGHYEDGFKTLSSESLSPFEEIKFWRAASLAGLGDWQQASEVMPSEIAIVSSYPAAIGGRLWPVFSEIALRAGNVPQGKIFLSLMEDQQEKISIPQASAKAYLKGEAARQEGKIEETKKHWEGLVNGPDDLYRAKASLALTRLLVDRNELTPDKAIDNLERIRYAWRGDHLEAQINSWLGRTYFESAQYIKGLKIMREAATFVPGTQLSQRITGDMSDLFIDLFLSEKLDALSPLDAVAVYNEFTELMPVDPRADKIVQRLAEHLVKSDLLGRAADLLDYQIKHRLSGEQAYTTAVRLAAIRLLDSQPEKAMSVLNWAQQKFSELPKDKQTAERAQELSLLRARALARGGRPDQALKMLLDMPQTSEVNRLRADTAWTAGYWDDAAEALGDVLLDRNISPTKPLDDMNINLILQRTIALNLSSDRIALDDMRTKYSELMNKTHKAKIFEVITRPRQSTTLSDRETLMGIVSEVDLFSDFLNSYKTMQAPPKTEPATAESNPAAQPSESLDQSSGSTSP